MDNPEKYGFMIKLYAWLWQGILPFAGLSPRLKEGLCDRLLQTDPGRADIWVQAASAGEAYLACLLLERLAFDRDTSLLVTTNTSQGFDIISTGIEKIAGNDRMVTAKTSYFPFDSPKIMERALNAIRPRLVVLLETELWPGLLSAASKAGTRVIVINGRISEKTFKRYKLFMGFWKSVAPNRVLAISDEDAGRFAVLFGEGKVETMPNMKFDRLEISRGTVEKKLEGIIEEDARFLVMGSVRKEEERDVANIVSDVLCKRPDTLVGIFPRHMHRLGQWERTLDRMGVSWRYRSKIGKGPAKSGTVILWDMFGELMPAYRLATAAFVGGSLAPLGGQNFLEPLSCGVRPVIGPWWDNFEWVGRELIDQGLVRKVKDRRQVAAELVRMLETPPSRDETQKEFANYLEKRKGGTERACNVIKALLGEDA